MTAYKCRRTLCAYRWDHDADKDNPICPQCKEDYGIRERYDDSAPRSQKKAFVASELRKAIEKLQDAEMLLQIGGPLSTIKQLLRLSKHIVEDSEQRVWDDAF